MSNKRKTEAGSLECVVKAEFVGQPPEEAMNLSVNGENIGLIKLGRVASQAWCRSIAKHLMSCSGFQVIGGPSRRKVRRP